MTYHPPFYKQLFHSARRTLTKHWLSFMPAIQIGITGSQGKTNTSYAVSKVLSSIGQTVTTDLDLDTIYNVPITALKVKPWTKYAVFELGIDQPNEMSYHLQIVRPKIGVITGVSPVHTDREHLGSLDNLIKEKRKMIEALPKEGYAVLNYDDENVRNMAIYSKAKILWYGTDSKRCDVWVNPQSITLSLKGTDFEIYEPKKHYMRLKLIGRQHIYTTMASYLVAKVLKLTNFENFRKVMTSLEPLLRRMSIETGPFDTIVLNDSLRANPSSVESGLETLSQIDHKKGRKIAVLAEMGELQYPEKEHRKIGKLVAKLPLDLLIGIGPQQKFVIDEATKDMRQKKLACYAKDVYQAAEILKKFIRKGDLIYLKGSLYRYVERVFHILEGKKPPPDLILEKYEI